MRRLWPLVVVMLLAANHAAAQDVPSFRPWRLVVFAGVAVNAGYPVGDLTVTIPRNAPGTPPPFTLLRAESEIGRRTGFELRVAVPVMPSFAIEVGGAYAAPELRATVSQDPELAGGASASERIDQYVIDVSGVYQLPVSWARRARPYVIAGAGYLRQLHEGRLLVETGSTLHAGGGLHYWLRGTRGERPFGLRGEARYVRRSGGIDFDDRSRGFASASALVFFGF